MYLLDTNVLSEVRRRSREARRWMESVGGHELFLSVITLGEIAKGVALKARRDPQAAAFLARWLGFVRIEYATRLLVISDEIALAWGQIEAQRPRGPDGLLAATAMVHGLALVTRNGRDFEDLPLQVVDPWRSASR